MTKIIGMIPARLNSTRFPRKVITDICGKPMIYWVYEQARKVKMLDNIFVVTADVEIKDVCDEYKIPCIYSKLIGTTAAQKIALEAENLDADIFLNIQGDEPLIDPKAIEQIIEQMLFDTDLYYVGLKSLIKSEKDFYDSNIVKVVTDNNNYALYFSRSPIPYKYDGNNAYRVLGLYGYRRKILLQFKENDKSLLEISEQGVEMLRIMEKGYKIKLFDTNCVTIGVDLPEHINAVEKKIKEKIKDFKKTVC